MLPQAADQLFSPQRREPHVHWPPAGETAEVADETTHDEPIDEENLAAAAANLADLIDNDLEEQHQ